MTIISKWYDIYNNNLSSMLRTKQKFICTGYLFGSIMLTKNTNFLHLSCVKAGFALNAKH